jgi:hypothetical protein
MSISTTCGNCLQPKDPGNYNDPYCQTCTTKIAETREYCTRENSTRAATEAENRKIIAEKGEDLKAGRITPEEAGLKPVGPQFDVSREVREALLARQQHVMANRWDPRVPYEQRGRFNIANLGAGSKPPAGFGTADGHGPVSA